MRSDASAVSSSGHAYSPAGELLLSRPRAARSPSKNTALASFRLTVWKYWKESGRHNLPWRKTKDPYRILVSEIMLQQTQVTRVIEKYKEFLKQFPTVRALAEAPLSEVLKAWSGLGYNRRAKYLHDTAKVVVAQHASRVPRSYAELRKLPGVGDYTAKAVRVFALNQPDVLIETNVRAAFIHHFFRDILLIHDRAIIRYAKNVAGGQDPRKWHWALMDYGAHLKRSGVRNNDRSAHYTKQSKFEGSLRQVRGAILEAYVRNKSLDKVNELYGGMFDSAIRGLRKDGLLSGYERRCFRKDARIISTRKSVREGE